MVSRYRGGSPTPPTRLAEHSKLRPAIDLLEALESFSSMICGGMSRAH